VLTSIEKKNLETEFLASSDFKEAYLNDEVSQIKVKTAGASETVTI
jgi:hypothetical protein